MKYVLSHVLPNKQDASVKAHKDINRFLSEEGFKDLTFSTRQGKNKFIRQINRFRSISKLAKTVQPDDLVVVQYPIYTSKLDVNLFYRRVVEKATCKVAIVHDLPFLRDSNPPQSKNCQREISYLNYFDTVIVHNAAMQNVLVKYGLKSKIVKLQLFDYYSDFFNKLKKQNVIPNRVLFAGNLTKSSFVNKLKSNNVVEYHLWGSIKNKNALSDTVKYHGIAPASKLPKYLKNGWGLVWDGDTIQSVSGLGGHYLRYIDPHKTSLYLASGIPVIVWKYAGIAPYIENNNLGIVVESINEIPDKIKQLSQKDYLCMMAAVSEVQQKLLTGKMIKSAIRHAVE